MVLAVQQAVADTNRTAERVRLQVRDDTCHLCLEGLTRATCVLTAERVLLQAVEAAANSVAEHWATQHAEGLAAERMSAQATQKASIRHNSHA